MRLVVRQAVGWLRLSWRINLSIIWVGWSYTVSGSMNGSRKKYTAPIRLMQIEKCLPKAPFTSFGSHFSISICRTDDCVLGSPLLSRRDLCVLFRTTWSTMDHLISGCTAMAPMQYMSRHNALYKVIHYNFADKHGLITGTCPIYRCEPQEMLGSSVYRMYWDW